VKQDVTVFNGTNSPIALALLMDSSASMESKLETAQQAAIGFVKRLRSHDLAEMIDFDNRAIISQAFTNDASKLEHAILQVSAGGPTSLYQAIYIAMTEFKKLKKIDTLQEARRQAVVLLSDGEDTTSMLSFDELMDIVKANETAIYAIGLHSADDPSKGFKKGEFELRQLADQTGGKAFFPQKIGDLSNVYGEISDELSSQYTLGYTSHNQRRDGTWRRVVVRVSRPNATARTKQGYFAAKS
jgi:Ca-activated chloride channel family protein